MLFFLVHFLPYCGITRHTCQFSGRMKEDEGDMLEALDCIEREEEAPQSELSILFSCLLNEDEWKVIIKVLLVCFLLETLWWDIDPSVLSCMLSVQPYTGLLWGQGAQSIWKSQNPSPGLCGSKAHAST